MEAASSSACMGNRRGSGATRRSQRRGRSKARHAPHTTSAIIRHLDGLVLHPGIDTVDKYCSRLDGGVPQIVQFPCHVAPMTRLQRGPCRRGTACICRG